MSKHVEDVEDRSNTHKGCNAMYVEDVSQRRINNRCLLKYVEDVEDRSNTQGCNVCMSIKGMSKMSKIDQIHIRAVMLCMSKTSKILKQTITGVY